MGREQGAGRGTPDGHPQLLPRVFSPGPSRPAGSVAGRGWAQVPGTAGKNKTWLTVSGSRAGATGVLRAPRKGRRGWESRAVKASPSQPPPWGCSILPGQCRPALGPRPEVPSGPAAQPHRLASAAPGPRPPNTHTLERLGSWQALTWLCCFGGL